ncbi:MAG: SRPBCC domain-containing protein [Pirellulaceae bacterium]
MSTRKHVHKEAFSTSAERLFAILHTPRSIRQWWGAASAIVIPEHGGTWAATWGNDEDGPDYIAVATIRAFEPPRRMVLDNYRYYAKPGQLPFDTEFTRGFAVFPTSQSATLQVTQDGFPVGSEADEYYAACEKGWQDTFVGIRKFLNGPTAEAEIG